MIDTSSLSRQIQYLGKGARGDGSSRFREKQVIGKYCPCFTIFHALCSVRRVPISRSLSTLWIWLQYPRETQNSKVRSHCKTSECKKCYSIFPGRTDKCWNGVYTAVRHCFSNKIKQHSSLRKGDLLIKYHCHLSQNKKSNSYLVVSRGLSLLPTSKHMCISPMKHGNNDASVGYTQNVGKED